MAFEHKDGQGTLWKNKYKEAGDNKPDFKGTLKLLDGQVVEIASWFKGQEPQFQSVQIQIPREVPPAARDEPPYGQAAPPPARPVMPPAPAIPYNPNEPDSIPF